MALATPVPAEGTSTDVEEYVAGSSLPAAEAALLAPVIQSFLRRHPGDDTSLMVRAAETATVAHAGQLRRSGEPYITHPIAVAGIVADLGLDAQTVAAALLHDAVEDTGVTNEVIDRDFGPAVALIVDGVTKLDRLQFDSKEAQQAATVRKMLVAMANDWRVLIIKLADRLHNMRTLSVMPEWKQRRTAQETLDIYAPAGPPARDPGGQVAARGPGLRHPPPQALRGDRADGGQPGPAARRVPGPRPGLGAGADGRLRGQRRGDRAPEAPVEHLREDGRAGQGVRRPLRPGRDPGHRRVGEGLLGRPGVDPRHLAPGAGPVQGLHQLAQVQPLPVAAHHGDRPRRQAHRGPGPDPRDAPPGRVRHRRPLGVQGEPGPARPGRRPPARGKDGRDGQPRGGAASRGPQGRRRKRRRPSRGKAEAARRARR